MPNFYFIHGTKATSDTSPDWVEITGAEYRALKQTKGYKQRRFIETNEFVLEVTPHEFANYRVMDDHSDYVKQFEYGWKKIPLEKMTIADELSYAMLIEKISETIGNIAIEDLLTGLERALDDLSEQERTLIHALFFTNPPKKAVEISKETGVPQTTISNRKRAIFKKIKKSLKKSGRNQK